MWNSLRREVKFFHHMRFLFPIQTPAVESPYNIIGLWRLPRTYVNGRRITCREDHWTQFVPALVICNGKTSARPGSEISLQLCTCEGLKAKPAGRASFIPPLSGPHQVTNGDIAYPLLFKKGLVAVVRRWRLCPCGELKIFVTGDGKKY